MIAFYNCIKNFNLLKGASSSSIAGNPTELNPFRNPNGWMNESETGDYKAEGYQTTSFVANEYDGSYQQDGGYR